MSLHIHSLSELALLEVQKKSKKDFSSKIVQTLQRAFYALRERWSQRFSLYLHVGCFIHVLFK